MLQQDALQKATVVRKSEGKQICTDSYRLQEPAVLQPSCLEICRLFFFFTIYFVSKPLLQQQNSTLIFFLARETLCIKKTIQKNIFN